MGGAIRRLRDPALREFLWWCAPALLVAFALRVILTLQLPYGYFHFDTTDFLLTPDRLINNWTPALHTKKTFLVPVLYTLPFLVGQPALIAIPIFQHLLGLGLVLLVGILCRLWFVRWRVFIIPLTLLAAANPFYLWYEHVLIAETIFNFTTVLLAVAGTLYALKQSRNRFVLLLVALFLEAGARPEGKLLFGFGILLVLLLHARLWRRDWLRIAIVLLLAALTHFMTKTGQAGLLLYTSVARFTPNELKSAPGFEPYIAPMRAELERLWQEHRSFPRVRHRKEISRAVERYLIETRNARGGLRRQINDLCLEMATETCRRNLFRLPAHAYSKFHAVATEAPGELFDNDQFFHQQFRAYKEAGSRAVRLSRGLTGEKLANEEAIRGFVEQHYGEVPWFNRWQALWLSAVNRVRLPDAQSPKPDNPAELRVVPGLPFYFLIAAAGLIAAMFRRGLIQPFHIAWGLSLAGFFFIIMLTGNVRPRFRFVFEPFWFLYIALFAEMIWLRIAKRAQA